MLLDTTVASLLLPRRRTRSEVAFHRPYLEGKTLAMSFQSVAELLRLPLRNRWNAARSHALEGFLRRFLALPDDLRLAETWAQLTVDTERLGRRLEAGDTWIAATAIRRQLPLLTQDRNFLDLGLPDLAVVSALAPQVRR